MYSIQSFSCAVVLNVLFRGLRYLNRHDSRMRTEFQAYEDLLHTEAGAEKYYTFRICAGMGKKAPSLTFRVQHGKLVRVAGRVPVQLEITFKSIPDAFLVFTGQLGVSAAYAAHRFYMRGNPNEAIGLVRCIELAEAYLFPRMLCRRLMPAVPKKQFSSLHVYAGLLCPLTTFPMRKELSR